MDFDFSNLENMAKFAQGIQNFVDLTNAVHDLQGSDSFNSLVAYTTWLAQLVEKGDDIDAIMDQFCRVAPKITKYINETKTLNEALAEEMEGNRSDIFDFDDSFFNIDDSTDDSADK